MGMILTRRHNVDRFGYLIPHRYGNLPMVGAVATYRPGEGRFGRGAVAVEEGTTNLVPSNQLKFEGWIAYSGAQVTLTQNVEFPEIGRNDATRIRTTGGTSTLKYYTSIEKSIANQAYTGSVYIKNIGSKPVRFGVNFGPMVTVNPGEWTRTIISVIGDGTTNFQFRFQAFNVDDDLDFIAWGPQVEYKSFATSFVDGTRARGTLQYDGNQLSVEANEGTFSMWMYVDASIPRGGEYPRYPQQCRLEFERGSFWCRSYYPGRFDLVAATDDEYTSIDVIITNTGWHLWTATWSDGEASLYIDGSKVGSRVLGDSAPSGRLKRLYVGNGGNYLAAPGSLFDEVLILPYAASEEEIVSWYEAQGPLPPHPQAALQWDRQTVRPAQMVKL